MTPKIMFWYRTSGHLSKTFTCLIVSQKNSNQAQNFINSLKKFSISMPACMSYSNASSSFLISLYCWYFIRFNNALNYFTNKIKAIIILPSSCYLSLANAFVEIAMEHAWYCNNAIFLYFYRFLSVHSL